MTPLYVFSGSSFVFPPWMGWRSVPISGKMRREVSPARLLRSRRFSVIHRPVISPRFSSVLLSSSPSLNPSTPVFSPGRADPRVHCPVFSPHLFLCFLCPPFLLLLVFFFLRPFPGLKGVGKYYQFFLCVLSRPCMPLVSLG